MAATDEEISAGSIHWKSSEPNGDKTRDRMVRVSTKNEFYDTPPELLHLTVCTLVELSD